MNVGIIGSGGREHALCAFLKKSNKINKIYCFPGNGGTSSLADNIRINPSDFEKFITSSKDFASINDIISCSLAKVISNLFFTSSKKWGL